MYKDRIDAAKKLAAELKTKLKEKENLIVIALPRGGVPMGKVISKDLNVPLDIVVPRKIGAPGHEEYAIGALTESGDAIFNEEEKARFSKELINEIVEKEKKEAQRRLKLFRGDRKDLDLHGKVALIVDDGIATGMTMLAAIKSCRKKGAKKIIVAVPVSAKDSLEKTKEAADEVICLETPAFFMAVGQWYSDFPQTSDEEVIQIMEETKK